MPLLYEVSGYDRHSERLKVSHHVPERRVASVKNIAGISPSDDGAGSYPLNSEQVDEIARVLETEIKQDNLDFFLEPYEESKSAAG